MLLETALLYFSVKLGVLVRTSLDHNAVAQSSLLQAIIFVFVMQGMLVALGLYRRTFRGSLEAMLLRLVLALCLGLVVLMALFYVIPELFLKRGAVAIAFIFSLALIMLSRVAFLSLKHRVFQRRILVLGVEQGIGEFGRMRRKNDWMGIEIVAFVPVSGEALNFNDESITHLDCPLLEYASRENVDEIVVACDGDKQDNLVQDLLDCKMSGVEVVDILSFVERQTGKIRVDMLQPRWLIYSEGFNYSFTQNFIKRLCDIVLSALALIFLAPIIFFVALAVWVEGKGREPIFYRQVRVGENWRLFQVIKFRSMKADVEDAQWTKINDTRVTGVGRFIRKLHLDELPQFINVLKGEMSLVGPRPEQAPIVELLSARIPYYAERHRVKPGITGWAQVRYPYGASEKDAYEKLQYDLYYVKNKHFFLDCVILLHTLEVVIFRRGSR